MCIRDSSWTAKETNERVLNKAGVKREPLDTVKARKLAYTVVTHNEETRELSGKNDNTGNLALYLALLCQILSGEEDETVRLRLSVYLCVCHKLELYETAKRIELVFGTGASFDLSYTAIYDEIRVFPKIRAGLPAPFLLKLWS